MIRYTDARLDASSIQDLPDGSIRVTAQMTHPGIFEYRNPNGSSRKEYRPPEEVFSKSALSTFAGAAVTINHPRQADGQRLVTSKSWKKDAVGHAGDNVREDGGHMVADLYIRDEDAVRNVKAGHVKHVSLGYKVDYDPTPGVTPDGQRYDGVQRNIRGNHIAILPNGVAPRGGSECVLRLDSQGDEVVDLKYGSMDEATLTAQITALNSELAKARTDAAELPKVKADLVAANTRIAELGEALKPERLDALADARSAVVALAKADGVETAGKSTVAIKRAVVAKRTPDLAARVDSLDENALDAVMTAYKSAPAASPLAAPLAVLAPETRTDAAPVTPTSRLDAVDVTKIPKIADLYANSVRESAKAWQNAGELARKVN